MAGSKTVGALTPCGDSHWTLQIDFVADASDGSVPDAVITDGNIIGKHLEGAEVIPGTGDDEPSGVFTVTVKNSRGLALLTDTDNPADSIGFVQPSIDIVINTPLTVSVGDIGNSNKLSVLLTFGRSH